MKFIYFDAIKMYCIISIKSSFYKTFNSIDTIYMLVYPHQFVFVENFRISFIGLICYTFYLSILLFYCYYLFIFINPKFV